MKNATPFFSDFFNTDCLVVEGEPHFSITGATKTLYGTPGGTQLTRFESQIRKMYGVETASSASDLREFPGICTVLVSRADRGEVKATAMTQDTFKALLKMYRGKDTKAGHYADELTDRLIGVSMDLILRKEAGLVHEEVTKEIDASILRVCHDEAKAYQGALGQLQLECYRSYYGKPKATEVPFPHTRQFGRWFASVLNEGVYSRVHANVIKEVSRLKEKNGGTTWQYLTEDVRTALMPTIMLMINNVRRDGWYNMDLIIKGLDEFYPRYDQGYKRPRFN